MIRFFAKTRQQLMTERKPKVYFKYAIGEILLVVIGILIALSINNLNESHKTNKLETRLLIELQNTGNSEIKKMERRISENENSRTSAEFVLSHLSKKVALNDTVAYHFVKAFSVWDAHIMFSAFENVKSHGMNFIKDDEIRRLLLEAYEVQIQFLERLMTRYDLYRYNTVQPELTESFKIVNLTLFNSSTGFVPLNFNPKEEHHKIVNMLKKSSQLLNQIISTEERILGMLEKLDKRLTDEIAAH